jgi:hypothetical protein
MQSGLQDDVWIQEDIALTSRLPELQPGRHTFIYQDVMSLVVFLLSHRPFAHEIVYAPIRSFIGAIDSRVRVYHELHSGDWW